MSNQPTTARRQAREEREAQIEAEYQADAAAQLQKTIELITAMHERDIRGELITDAQIAACFNAHILGSLWFRIEDYCEYVSRTRRLHRVARNDDTSIALDKFFQQMHLEARMHERGLMKECMPVIGETRRQALLDAQPTPRRRRSSKCAA